MLPGQMLELMAGIARGDARVFFRRALIEMT